MPGEMVTLSSGLESHKPVKAFATDEPARTKVEYTKTENEPVEAPPIVKPAVSVAKCIKTSCGAIVKSVVAVEAETSGEDVNKVSVKVAERVVEHVSIGNMSRKQRRLQCCWRMNVDKVF